MVCATDEPANEEEKDNGIPSVFKAVECLTKGIELPLPDGRQFEDKDGQLRRRVRIRWRRWRFFSLAPWRRLGARKGCFWKRWSELSRPVFSQK